MADRPTTEWLRQMRKWIATPDGAGVHGSDCARLLAEVDGLAAEARQSHELLNEERQIHEKDIDLAKGQTVLIRAAREAALALGAEVERLRGLNAEAAKLLAMTKAVDIREDPHQRGRFLVDLTVAFICDTEQARRFKDLVCGRGLVEIAVPQDKLEAK